MVVGLVCWSAGLCCHLNKAPEEGAGDTEIAQESKKFAVVVKTTDFCKRLAIVVRTTVIVSEHQGLRNTQKYKENSK